MMDDGFQYRSAVPTTHIEKDKPSVNDEANFNTLHQVRDILSEAIDNLSNDFTSFDVLGAKDEEEAVKRLAYQIGGRQIAYNILSPVLEMVRTTIEQVDDKYRR